MMVRGISVSEIAKLLKKSERTVMKKMNCQDADFSFDEVNEIMDTYFPNQSVGYIFGRT